MTVVRKADLIQSVADAPQLAAGDFMLFSSQRCSILTSQ